MICGIRPPPIVFTPSHRFLRPPHVPSSQHLTFHSQLTDAKSLPQPPLPLAWRTTSLPTSTAPAADSRPSPAPSPPSRSSPARSLPGGEIIRRAAEERAQVAQKESGGRETRDWTQERLRALLSHASPSEYECRCAPRRMSTLLRFCRSRSSRTVSRCIGPS